MSGPPTPGRMRAPTLLLLGLSVLAASAGCLAPDAEEGSDASREQVTAAGARGADKDAAPREGAGAPAAADAGADRDAARGTDEEDAAPEPVETVLAWDGSTASAVCVMPAQRCDILQQPESSWNEFSALGVPGRPLRASGVLTWEPATPATQELHVFVFSLDETGMPVDSTRITGPSPLAFDVDLSSWTGVDFAYSLHGHHEVAAALIVETSQPFHMETTIVSVLDP